ncbi:5-oxoprolinase subunit PxpB [Dendrosporobacter sp. 1207_IL3150]|uniref:5-oxoprolinase subunit PxpB n=1 Tax=Dendrosporobacter sp. 1207_IL3150 TaxID=3084054 RepID=UPI002FDADF1F
MNDWTTKVKFRTAGDHGLVVEFADIICADINQIVKQLTKYLNDQQLKGLIEVVPTYRSVTVYFDPLIITRPQLSNYVSEILSGIKHFKESLPSRVVYVPVCYSGVMGPDLEFVARYTGLLPNEVVKLHTSKPYLVYMLGFTPGFPYLGGLPEQISVPRQEKPRTKIPAGSVGIGGNQTGFYTIESPGEWWLIGRTPIKAFNPLSPNPFLVSAGDYLHFTEITIEEYFIIRRAIEAGTYQLEVSYLQDGDSNDYNHSTRGFYNNPR